MRRLAGGARMRTHLFADNPSDVGRHPRATAVMRSRSGVTRSGAARRMHIEHEDHRASTGWIRKVQVKADVDFHDLYSPWGTGIPISRSAIVGSVCRAGERHSRMGLAVSSAATVAPPAGFGVLSPRTAKRNRRWLTDLSGCLLTHGE